MIAFSATTPRFPERVTRRPIEKENEMICAHANLLRQRLFACGVLSWLALLLLSTDAFATCSFSNGQTAGVYVVTVPTQTLARDVAVGTVLFRGMVAAVPSSGYFASCSSPGRASRDVGGASLISSTDNAYTYATEIDGIGVRFLDISATGTRYWGGGVPGETWPGAWGWGGTTLGVEVVRTQPASNKATSGTVSSASSGIMTLDGLLVATIRFAPFAVAVRTCDVTTPAVALTLQRVHTSQLPAVNSTYGDTNFNIGLNCVAGVKVAITMTDASKPDNTSTTLSLSPASTASGIGYQIVNNGVPIAFGPDSAAIGTVHQFVVTPSTVAGSYNLTFSARYIRTGTIVPGSADGLATFTMSYQ
jgi:type 1 fimbria pilin